LSFSIEYPGEWQNNGGVFDDSNGNKIAELLPGLVSLQPGQKCFDVAPKNSGLSQLISQTDLSIARRQGVLRVNKVIYEGGYPNWTDYWYPNTFCLMEGDKAFVMTFYEHEIETEDRKLFIQILATLKFE